MLPAAALLLASLSSAAPAPRPELRFSVVEGSVRNYFCRRGRAAAHLLASSGEEPRLIVAFPAGNTGIGLWFEKGARPVELEAVGAPAAVERADGMRGVTAHLSASGALRTRAVVLGSVRVLRDYVYTGSVPPEISTRVAGGPPLVVTRTLLDGRHRLELRLQPLKGASIRVDGNGAVSFAAAAPSGPLEFQLTALTDEAPLDPLPADELLKVRRPGRDLDALEFLAYRQKFLAGSWRFLTYFGRDTLLSARLLLPVLRPAAAEAALGSVLDRLGPDGEVAHEEDIGDFAALRRVRAGEKDGGLEKPFYDYKMIDGDFLLAPVLASYLLDTPEGRAGSARFLARKTPAGLTYAAALERNLDRVRRLAAPYAAAPSTATLIALKPGQAVGEWRDSGDGLGGGRVPFDVNAALVPAALAAGARLEAAPPLGPRPDAAAEFDRLARAWAKSADAFQVEIPAAEAWTRLQEYAREQGLDLPAGAAPEGAVRFHALALDGAGRPIPVLNTDEGFVLLFTNPEPPALDQIVASLTAPFPRGLASPVGYPVADPAYLADPAERAKFSRGAYHGAVVWSWQQAMLAAGLARQLERKELPPATKDGLRRAQTTLWAAIKATSELRHSELWSWKPERGRMVAQPFGQGGGDADESNAAQLWSTVYLAVTPPGP
jgi:hypothetical protein